MRRRAAIMWIVCFIIPGALPALAQNYPPTRAGLRKLVADDAAILPAAYAASLRKQEADWEKGIGITCYPGDGCFPRAKDMIVAIQGHIARSNGYVFYQDEWSATFPIAPADQAGLGLISPVVLKQDIPQIVSPLTAQARVFNLAIRKFALGLWDAQGGPPRTNPHHDKAEDVDLDYMIIPNPLKGVLSISINLGWDMKTGVHGNFSNSDFNWNLRAGREVMPGDIFASNKLWQVALDAAADAAFTKIRGAPFPPNENDNLYDFSQPVDVDGIHAGYNDPHQWRITAAGLLIDTQEGEVCGYACGMPTATIPWSSLNSSLKSGGLVHNS
jgi:hypothetical protein